MLRKRRDFFVKRTPFPFALRQMQQSFRNPILLAGLAGTAIVLGISGPFNTLDRFTLPERLAYWGAVVAMTFAAGRFGSAMLEKPARALPRPLRIGLRSLGSALAVAAVLQLVNLALHDGLSSPQMLLSVLAICLVIEILGDLIRNTPPPAAPPAILSRLPLEKRGDLVALCVQDHYVEVITTKGRSMILMRLSDAMLECAPTQGLQIHRSNWVALDQVAEVSRTRDNASVLTRTGERLTVARQRLKDLAEAGLLPRKGA